MIKNVYMHASGTSTYLLLHSNGWPLKIQGSLSPTGLVATTPLRSKYLVFEERLSKHWQASHLVASNVSSQSDSLSHIFTAPEQELTELRVSHGFAAIS